MKFYKEMFLEDPPDDIWEGTEERFDMKNFSYVNVNIYRLAVIYSLKNNNPDFLAPPTYTNQATDKVKATKANSKKIKKKIRKNRRNKLRE